jgi:hypothetical protein
MAINQMRLVLSAYHPDGKPIEPEDFCKALGTTIAPYTPYGKAAKWHAVGLEIASLRISDFDKPDVEEPSGEYAKAVKQSLLSFAGWLETVPTKNVRLMKKSCLDIYVLLTLLMDQDQMEFALPHELNFQLGRLQMRFSVLSKE